MDLDALQKKLNKMVVEQGIDAPEVLAFSQVVDKAILEYYKNRMVSCTGLKIPGRLI